VLATGSTDTVDCNLDAAPSHNVLDLAGYQVRLAAGTSSDLEMSTLTNGASPPTLAGWPSPYCMDPYLHLDVEGDTASTPSGESCTYAVVRSGGTNYQVTEAFSLTMDLDGAGTTLTLEGDEQARYSGSTSGTCTHALVGVAARL
jgi:uncharacterized protein (DUF2126 family)